LHLIQPRFNDLNLEQRLPTSALFAATVFGPGNPQYLLTVLAICPALSLGLVEVSQANISHCALEPQLLGTCADQTRR
ncbi:hypothetical protein CH063_04475, partial [Colletotrichum higginsianum]